MKKLAICIFAVCTCFVSQGFAETYLSDYFEMVHDENLENEAFQIDVSLQEKYQAVARQFVKKGSAQTNIVTYETLYTGVHVHVGWYVDGYIVTALDGTEAGKQIVFINGTPVSISYKIKAYSGYFKHDHGNGWKITSYPTSQIFKY